MVRVLIIDDHEIVREGIKRLFDGSMAADFGEAGTEKQALALMRERDWDLVILDLTLGDQNGTEVLKSIQEIRPHVPVLVLSMHSEEQYARRAFKAGAVGYITKDSSRRELFNAINQVIEGGRYVSTTLAEALTRDLQRRGDDDRAPHERLSDRELEVLRLIGCGKTVKEIAFVLRLSHKTVSTYRARILEKMNSKTNAELAVYAIQNHVV